MIQHPNSLEARDVAYVLHPYTNAAVHAAEGPLVIDRGEGIHVYRRRMAIATSRD